MTSAKAAKAAKRMEVTFSDGVVHTTVQGGPEQDIREQ